LEQGRLVFQGNSGDAVARYLNTDSSSVGKFECLAVSKSITLTRLEAAPSVVRCNERMVFTIEIGAYADEVISDIALLIYAASGERVAIIDLRSSTGVYRIKPDSNLRLQSKVASLPLVEADYSLGLWINSTSISHCFLNLLTFTILPSEYIGGVVPREPQHRGFVELQTQVEVV
jgi:hypothetical protein